MKTTILILTLTLFFSACATKNPYIVKKPISSYKSEKRYENINISDALMSHFKEWKGVKYKYGGHTKKGIDCSFFVQDAFEKTLNKKIPRTTYSQAKTGKRVDKNELELGDLVFFITSKKGTRHVGIYLGHGDFMHVSTSKGVIISSLSNPYWKKHYWKAKRVLSYN